jgi:hypothetical protein
MWLCSLGLASVVSVAPYVFVMQAETQ